MANVDIIILVILALYGIIGYNYGFGKSLVKIFGWILSILVVILITDLVANALLSSDKIKDFVLGPNDSINSFIIKKIPKDLRNINMADLKEKLTLYGMDGVKEMVKEAGGPIISVLASVIISYIVNPIYLASNIQTLGEIISIELSLLVFEIILGAVLFIIVKIVMAIIARVIGNIGMEDKNILSRVGGALVGIFRGIMYVTILLFFFSFALNLDKFKPVAAIKKDFDKSLIADKSINVISKVYSELEETNKGKTNIKKAITILGYENGSDIEIAFWKEVLDELGNIN